MPNILQVKADDADELLNAGAYGAGAIIRVQTSATQAGAYADLSGTGSTPTLALATTVYAYTAYDPNGLSTSWYRVRYENVGATRLSDWSVTFQAGTRQLCAVDAVKSRLSITDTTDDMMITDLVDQVSAWIEGYTGRRLTPENAATYTFDTNAGYVLRIPRGIRSVTSMGIASMVNQPDSGGTYTTVTAASILLRPRSGDLPNGWPATEVWMSRGTNTTPLFGTIQNGATITGDFGFASTPFEIQSVCLDAVLAAYSVRKMGASGVIGMEDTAAVPWVRFFSKGSPQRGTLDRYRYYGFS